MGGLSLADAEPVGAAGAAEAVSGTAGRVYTGWSPANSSGTAQELGFERLLRVTWLRVNGKEKGGLCELC